MRKSKPALLYICLSAFIALMVVMPSMALADNIVKQTRFAEVDNTSRLVLEFENEPKFTYFLLSNPNRLVIDLAGVNNDFSLSRLNLKSQVIERVRHSTPKTLNDTRLVIESSKKLEPTLFTLPPSEQFPHRLVVELVDPNPAPAVQTVINSDAPDRDRSIIVVIDPGHGGIDPGSIGPAGTYEKRIVLSIGKMLQQRINAEPGMKAVMTRNGDYYVSPNERPKIAVRENADLLVSIHADAFSTPQPQGGSVWVLSKGRADSELGRLLEQTERSSEMLGAAADVIEDRDTERYFAETIFNMSMDLSRASSYELSNKVIREMRGVTRMHKTTPQSASFAVLTAPETPSILVEVGFISNPQEEKNLNWQTHRERLADAMFESIKAFFKKTPPDGTLWAQWKTSEPQRHRVSSGESLSLLAQRYGVTVKSLKNENNLSNDMVRIGQVLTIPSS